MANSKSEIKQLPDLYLALDQDGIPQFYSTNPSKVRNADDLRNNVIDIIGEINDLVPISSRWNPIAVQIRMCPLRSTQPFSVQMIKDISERRTEAHFESMCGELMDIIDVPVRYGKYTIGGYVIDEYGNNAELRLFDPSGNCFDGQEGHRLVIVGGEFPILKDGSPEIPLDGDPDSADDFDFAGEMNPEDGEAPAEPGEEELLKDNQPGEHSERLKEYFGKIKLVDHGKSEKIENIEVE